MKEYRATMSPNGRIVIPAKCRKALNMQAGELIILRVVDKELHLCSINHSIKRAQDTVTQAMKGKKGLVNELIQERRAEADNE